MFSNRTPLYGILTSGVFLLIDQWLKWQSLHTWNSPYLLGKWFGWFPFLNKGVAFGLPLPMLFVILFTIPVVMSMLFLAWRFACKQTREGYLSSFGLTLVIGGSISNLIDRLLYSHTVDYILIFTGVINVADLLILLGFLCLFFSFKTQSRA